MTAPPIFYAKPYPGRFTDYVQKEIRHEKDIRPTEILEVHTKGRG